MNRFLVIDDHSLLRSGLVLMLKAKYPKVFIGEAGSADEALRLLETKAWTLAILDIGMLGRSGLEVLRDFRKLRPHLPVLILTGLTDDAVAIRCFEAGAMGYLSKACTETELLTAVQKVLAGGRHLTTSLAEKLVANLNSKPHIITSENRPEIRGRMFDVMLHLGKGHTIRAIAADMGLSATTVSTYRKRLLEQLQMKTTADIVRYCLTQGLTQ